VGGVADMRRLLISVLAGRQLPQALFLFSPKIGFAHYLGRGCARVQQKSSERLDGASSLNEKSRISMFECALCRCDSHCMS
jgi:hypothetical protein